MTRLVVVLLLSLVAAGCTATAPPDESSPQPLRPRAAHTATMLGDGRVLIAGGCAVDGCETSEVEPSSEFYVPGRGFVPGPRMLHPRSSHSATLLPDGRVLIVGGWAKEGTDALTEAEMYNPATGRFEPAGNLEGQAILLTTGKVLIVGDRSGLYDPATGSFTPGAALPQRRHASASIVLPSGEVLITGGQDAPRHGLNTTVVYDPRNGRWRPGPRMASPRFKHAISMLDGGRVMVLGGTTDDTELLASTEILDLSTNSFSAGPMMSTPRYKFPDAVAHTSKGRLVVAGGTQVDVLAADGRSFDTITSPGTGSRRWFPTATALPDGSVLIIGGYDQRIRVFRDAQVVTG